MCKWFGHVVNDRRYGKYVGGAEDGLGTQHAYLLFECKRCPEKISLKIHLPPYFRFDREIWREVETSSQFQPTDKSAHRR